MTPSDSMDPSVITFTSTSNVLTDLMRGFLSSWGVPTFWVSTINIALMLLIALILVGVSFTLSRRFLYFVLRKIAANSRVRFIDTLHKNKLPHYLAMLAPYNLVHEVVPIVFRSRPSWIAPLSILADIYCVFIVFALVMVFVYATIDSLKYRDGFRYKPLKSYAQVLQLVLLGVAAVCIYCILTGNSPFTFFTAIGAASAVIMLLMKDTLTGVACSLQISFNNLVQVGDWITVTRYGADGIVEEISLTTVKVRNFDNTITTLPATALVADSFQNWRGMKEKGCRRFVRTFHVRLADVHFVSDEELERYAPIGNLAAYIAQRRERMAAVQQTTGVETAASPLNAHHITNVDLFMQYAEWYLRTNPRINADTDLLVRQQVATSQGLPIQIYAFANTTVWAEYENVHAEIMNHLYSSVSAFGLRIFEAATSSDTVSINILDKG